MKSTVFIWDLKLLNAILKYSFFRLWVFSRQKKLKDVAYLPSLCPAPEKAWTLGLGGGTYSSCLWSSIFTWTSPLRDKPNNSCGISLKSDARPFRTVLNAEPNEPKTLYHPGHPWSHIGSLSNDVGDGNENGKKILGSDKKTTTLHVQHACSYLSLPSLHDCDVKLPNFSFCAWRTWTQDNDFLLFWTRIQSFRIQLQKNSPTFDKLREVE